MEAQKKFCISGVGGVLNQPSPKSQYKDHRGEAVKSSLDNNLLKQHPGLYLPSALGRERQEEQKFKVIFSYITYRHEAQVMGQKPPGLNPIPVTGRAVH